MSKLTQVQERELNTTLNGLNMAISFIEKETVVVARSSKRPMTGKCFANKESDTFLLPINKQHGSGLVGLYTAKRELLQFLQKNSRHPEQYVAMMDVL